MKNFRLRFSIKSMFCLIAFAALFLGLQARVSSKANQYVKEIRNPTNDTHDWLIRDTKRKDVLEFAWGPSVAVAPLSWQDVIYIRRRCDVTFATTSKFKMGRRITEYRHRYRFFCFRITCDSEAVSESIGETL